LNFFGIELCTNPKCNWILPITPTPFFKKLLIFCDDYQKFTKLVTTLERTTTTKSDITSIVTTLERGY